MYLRDMPIAPQDVPMSLIVLGKGHIYWRYQIHFLYSISTHHCHYAIEPVCNELVTLGTMLSGCCAELGGLLTAILLDGIEMVSPSNQVALTGVCVILATLRNTELTSIFGSGYIHAVLNLTSIYGS